MENYFDTKEWLSQRLGRFTASEIHKLFTNSRTKGQVFGQTAMTYIRQKAAEILTQEVKEDMNFKQAEWGKANESEAWAMFEEISSIKGNYYGAANPTFFPHGDFEGGSPDWESLCGKHGADFKCPYNSDEHLLNLILKSADELKDARWEYYCQLQHSMYRRGWQSAFFVSYDPRMAMEQQRIKIIAVYPDIEWRKEFDQRIDAAVLELKTILGVAMSTANVIDIAPPKPETITLQKIA